MGAASWMIHPVLAATSSDDTTILPVDTPPDQHHYNQAQHGPKSSVGFGRPVYYAWDIVITLDPAVSVEMKYLHDPETDSRRPRLVRNRIC